MQQAKNINAGILKHKAVNQFNCLFILLFFLMRNKKIFFSTILFFLPFVFFPPYYYYLIFYHKKSQNMKKVFLLCLLIPVFGMSQTKTVLNASRYFTKPDKVLEFEKALGAHAQKYHKGDWHWRVWSIESGPDAGGYMITEGPSDWATIDGRGDLSAEHTMDWNKNVAPNTTAQYQSGYYEFEADLSTVQMTDYADKIIINHMISKPGKMGAVNAIVTKLKKVWEAGNESVAVYTLTASGDPGLITVTRLKAGLKELADGYRKPVPERYVDVYGAGSWEAYLKDYSDAVERRWSELLIYKPNLSSK